MPKTKKVYLATYVTEELENKIYELKMRPEYVRMSVSKLVQMLVIKGLELTMKEIKNA